MAYCRKCGAELSEGAQFCRKCGAGVEKNTIAKKTSTGKTAGERNKAAAGNKRTAAAKQTAAAAKQVIEWLETSVEAPDAPGEMVISTWSNGRLIDPAALAGMAKTAARTVEKQVKKEQAASAGKKKTVKEKREKAPEKRTAEPQGTKFCRYCGKELDRNAKFCRYCGKQL